MHPLNPFLRAFFRSTLPPQCSPVQHHVLLIPTTEVLLTSRDRETQALYSDLASSEDFLASHVLRVHGGVAPLTAQGKEVSFRENRSKAKQFTTLNGRTVIIKDTFIYSNKGFKSLNQAQLLSDTIYSPDTADAQPWLVYYISRPLVGVYDAISIIPASIDMESVKRVGVKNSNSTEGGTSSPRKKQIKSFGDLLNNFPMIARQMQPGLERLFKEFAAELQTPLPEPPVSEEGELRPRAASVSSGETLAASWHGSTSSMSMAPKSTIILKDEEDMLRRSLETAVTAAIDLFQMVDKAQLSHLGATTELTGPVVERMIERYITEQVHDAVLFPKICAARKQEDAELDVRIRQMGDVDISQVGISVEGSFAERRELSIRLAKGATLFKKMGVASSPQEMIETLLATQKLLSKSEPTVDGNASTRDGSTQAADPEKPSTLLTINADTLVSLLLVVVIRASVRHLNARLSYMRHFIFIDDVESGEVGYALSTFEAVLSYLSRDPGLLRRASKLNRKLWDAAKGGNVSEVKRLLESNDDADDSECGPEASQKTIPDSQRNGILRKGLYSEEPTDSADSDEPKIASPGLEAANGSLAHVFPFQRPISPEHWEPPIKKRKRVSVASYSSASSSGVSFHSRTDSYHSRIASVDEELSGQALAAAQNASGESLLMMVVESNQPKTLQYLLSREDISPLSNVLEDTNNDGATLLCAAVQTGSAETADALLEFLLARTKYNEHGESIVRSYIARQDSKGRSVAHYLFNLPEFISRIGHLLPWRLKDRNGQTPLFALCRSYDHEDYRFMVESALTAATRSQRNGEPLHVDEHIDGKGNTLLHIVNDSHMVTHLLQSCDSDVNAANDKQFTPLMVSSKYGRTDLVRLLFSDPRVDLFARDLRGLTAVELAKDDEVRNRIDDLVLLSTPPSLDGRITAVVRSFFVEDGTVRLILKSGAPNLNATITVTTSRRTPVDFESLSRWLALELPASWIPSISNLQSPFMIPSKPSRAVLRDIQLRLDSFLRVLLAHPTFSTHEMVWEFFLVPDIDPTMLAERSKKKAETRTEMVRDEYDPISDVREVELFVSHAKDSVRGVHHATRSVLRRANKLRHAHIDVFDAAVLASKAVSTLVDLPNTHISAFNRFTKTLGQIDFSPLTEFFYSMTAVQMATNAVLVALNRPSTLIGSMATTQKAIDRHMQSLRRSDRWPLGLLDDTRNRLQREAAERAEKSLTEMQSLGKELRYTQQVVAGELAAWQDEKARMGRRACKELARRMVVIERDRLEGMRRAIRGLGLKEKEKPKPAMEQVEQGQEQEQV
ncbi:hypothetical protein NA57DRAFT_45697 [Rhizodiscina lignyota]|uniref:VPS9 domain-containing protein n=1 Tax=Rhizodiscina lignyota TaxID=1504668 RepID=A0A9P4M6L5_9PEZI|nr:hypothetical protein NA57DRAFT_45697 [Rhizodiscina lignyota]